MSNLIIFKKNVLNQIFYELVVFFDLFLSVYMYNKNKYNK